MQSRLAVSLVTGVLLVGVTVSAEAQRRRGLVDVTPDGRRHGFWMNIGVGAGSEQNRIDDGSPFSKQLTKPSFSLRLGGTVSPNFRLGGEIAGWGYRYYDAATDIQSNRTDYLVGAMLIGQLYPSRRAGFFVKGGGGLSWAGSEFDDFQGFSEGGFAWTAGAGYEIKLSRSIFLTPTIDFMEHRSTTTNDLGQVTPAFIQRVTSIGVALTIQPGH